MVRLATKFEILFVSLPADGRFVYEMFRKVWISTFFTLCISGCAVGPDFVPPEANVSQQWLTPSDARLTENSLDGGLWWELFNDPNLNRLVQTAFKDNLRLQVAALRVLEARAQLGSAKGLQFPQQQALGGQAIKLGLSDHASNLAIVDQSFWDFQVGFDAVWELDFWGRFRRGIEAASAEYIAAQADYDDALVTITAEVACVYIVLRTFEERLKLAHENVEVQRETQRIAEVRFRNSLVPELDATVLSNMKWP